MKVLVFDVESNGLHGEAFAVAGVLVNKQGHILSQVLSRCPITGPIDPWVVDNVLGPMRSIPETASDTRTLRAEFWKWYLEAKGQADLIVASNPYPVEARFLIACQEEDLKAREFDHPFPYYDLSSMLYARGITSPLKRRAFVIGAAAEYDTHDAAGDEPHNPLWDAKSTAFAVLKLAEQTP